MRQATLSSVARAIFIPFLPLHGLHSNRRDVSGWRLRQREGRMSLSVLVIEGDPTVAGFLVEVFSQQGWNVCVPRNGTGVAVTLLGDRRFDLITVSYRFPPTNGVEIIRLIRELEHRKATPVLMLTGGHEMTTEALAAGANEVLYKPIAPGCLVAAVFRHSSSPVAP